MPGGGMIKYYKKAQIMADLEKDADDGYEEPDDPEDEVEQIDDPDIDELCDYLAGRNTTAAVKPKRSPKGQSPAAMDKRIKALELKVAQLTVILQHITGVKTDL